MTAMKLLILRLCLAACLLTSAAVEGARLDNLFQAQVQAEGRDSAARDAALQQALRQVLVRVTGSSGLLQEPAAASLLQEPGRFVQQFRFTQGQGGAYDPSQAPALWVQFDGVALAKEIRARGLPLWGRDRPDVLVWLAVDDRGQRAVVSERDDSAAAQAVLRAAALRGLPVTLPLMDLQDQRAIGFTDIWGGFVTAIESASQRYRPQLILIGKLDRSSTGGGWRSEWNLLGAGSNQSWIAHAAELDAAVEQGIVDGAEWLALRYAVVPADESARPLVVENIAGLKDYARVYNYLLSLTPVDQVAVVRVADRQVEFNLTLNAQERNLLQVIRLGKTLQAVDDPAAWRFRLTP